jgi:hypothetical protein
MGGVVNNEIKILALLHAFVWMDRNMGLNCEEEGPIAGSRNK